MPSLVSQPSVSTKSREPQRTPQRGLTQAYELRDTAAKHALELKDESAEDLQAKALRARALKDNVCVWEIACTRIRIYKGQPLPGSLRPERKPTKKKQLRAEPREAPSSASDPPSEIPQGDSKGG